MGIFQRHLADSDALSHLGNFMIASDDIKIGLYFLKKALSVAPSDAARQALTSRLLSLHPHRYSTTNLQTLQLPSTTSSIVIVDKGIDRSFVEALLEGSTNTTVHFFTDLNNDHMSDLLLSSIGQRLGCRDVINRYDPYYKVMADACHSLGQRVSDIFEKDRLTQIVFPVPGLAASITLTVSDSIFWSAYYEECVHKIINQNAAEQIIFILGTNSSLWSVAEKYYSSPHGSKVWYCAPSKNPIAHAHAVTRIRLLAFPTASTTSFDVTDPEVNQHPVRADVGHYVRYFLHCIKKRAVTKAAKLPTKKRDSADLIVIAGGYFTNYLESWKAVAEGVSRSGLYDVAVCDFGPKPMMAADVLGVVYDEGTTVTGQVGHADYVDIFTPLQNDIFPPRLGKWLPLYHQVQIQSLLDAAQSDISVPKIISDTLSTKIEGIFSQTIPQLLFTLSFSLSYLGQIKPSLVLLCPSRPGEAMILAAAAHALQIKTVTLDVHILEPSYARNLAVYADYAFVISEHFAESYAKYFRIDRDAVYVIGSLRLGQMLERLAGLGQSDAQRSLGWPTGLQQTLLLITQPIAWEILAVCIDQFAKAIAGFDERPRICLRLHREESAERRLQYTQIFAKYGLTESVFYGDGDIGTLIVASDCIVGFFSTALIEAQATGRPVIVVQPKNKRWIVDLPEMGLATAATSVDEISDALRHVFKGKTPYPPVDLREGQDVVISRVEKAIDHIIAGGKLRDNFLSPPEIFVKFNKPHDIVG
jgi:hypothetical protein